MDIVRVFERVVNDKEVPYLGKICYCEHMKITAILTADKVILADAKTMKINMEGLFEIIGAQAFPVRHPQMVVVVVVHDAEGLHKIKMAIKNPDGKEVASMDAQMQLNNSHTIANTVNDLIFDQPGKYIIDVSIDNISAQSDFEVRKV